VYCPEQIAWAILAVRNIWRPDHPAWYTGTVFRSFLTLKDCNPISVVRFNSLSTCFSISWHLIFASCSAFNKCSRSCSNCLFSSFFV
jgi:hypothetical protein